MNRRDFLFATAGTMSALDMLAAVNPGFARQLEKQVNRIGNLGIDAVSSDEDFWGWVRSNYSLSTNLINLNNGGVSPQPKIVQEAHIRNYQLCNEAPSYYMWRVLDQGREALRNKLAVLCGASPDEIAINRNSTEGLNTVIFGLNLKEGDEIVLSRFDYPNMVNAWKQREKRDKVKLVWIDIPQPLEDDEQIVKLYEDAITSRTRIVHITHMINWTGNLVPAKKIADMAHKKGCEVIVDAAHTFAHIDYKIEDTGADYFAASLHKWLCAPFGSGLLYIKKEKIKNVWALLSSLEPDGADMKKFESLGTRSFASEMAIGTAIDFHNVIGAKRKEARLRYLKDYWATKAAKLPGSKFVTSLKPQYSCALANIGFEGWQAHQVETKLYDRYKIHTVSIIHEKVNGIRVTPNVYTNLEDLDQLIKGLTEVSSSAPPAVK
jgi:selenocysteine lyase/cysteine desulfurase